MGGPANVATIWMRLIGVPLSFVGITGVFISINNMITGHVTRIPAPFPLILASIMATGGLTMLFAKPKPGAVKHDPMDLSEAAFAHVRALAAQDDGKLSAAAVALALSISIDDAQRGLEALAARGDCRRDANEPTLFVFDAVVREAALRAKEPVASASTAPETSAEDEELRRIKALVSAQKERL